MDKVKQSSQQVRLTLPKFWVGLLFAAASFVLIVLVMTDPEYRILEEVKFWYNERYGFINERIDSTPLHPYTAFAALSVIAGWAYWLYCVHRVHKVMAEATEDNHAISPNRAVWFHLIPIYNLFWVFKWTGEVAKSVHKHSYQVMPEKMFGVLLFLALLIQYSMSLDITYLIPSTREAFRQAIAPPVGQGSTPVAFLVLRAVLCRAVALLVGVFVGIKVSQHIRAMMEDPIPKE